MTASEVVAELAGVFVLDVATVTARAEPIVAPVDGLFFRARLWIGFPPGSLRAGHLRARPAVSACFAKGEDVCVLAHGRAREIQRSDPLYDDYQRYGRECYGARLWDYWTDEHYRDREGPSFTAWIEPRKMFAMKRTSG